MPYTRPYTQGLQLYMYSVFSSQDIRLLTNLMYMYLHTLCVGLFTPYCVRYKAPKAGLFQNYM